MYRLLVFFCFLLPCSAQGQVDVYDPETLTEVRLYFATDDWAERLAAYKESPEEQRLTARLEVNGISYDSVGVRYKGNSSYNAVHRKGERKLPFNIKIDHVLKDQVLPGGYDKLKLSNGFRDPSFVREVLGYEIARTYMPASRSNFARVFVNDEYLGVYTSVESVDKQFLEHHFGEKDGVLIKCDPIWGYEAPAHCPQGDKSSLEYLGSDSTCYYGLYELKSDRGWTELIELARILQEEPEKLESILDIDQTLWLLAFNNVLVNLDSYLGAFCHNFYLYQDETGVFHPVIWDLNLAFGGFQLINLPDQSTYTATDMQQMSMFVHYKHGTSNRPLITQLMKVDLYRKIYVAHCKTILEDFFADSTFLQRVNAWQEVARAAVFEDSCKLYSDSAFVHNVHTAQDADGTSIIGLAELMTGRARYLLEHKLIEEPAPEIREVDHQLQGGQCRITAQVKGAEQAWLFFREHPGRSYRRVRMEAVPAAADSDSAFRSYAVELPCPQGLQYYVVGEGPLRAGLFPARAGKAYLEIDPNG